MVQADSKSAQPEKTGGKSPQKGKHYKIEIGPKIHILKRGA